MISNERTVSCYRAKEKARVGAHGPSREEGLQRASCKAFGARLRLEGVGGVRQVSRELAHHVSSGPTTMYEC